MECTLRFLTKKIQSWVGKLVFIHTKILFFCYLVLHTDKIKNTQINVTKLLLIDFYTGAAFTEGLSSGLSTSVAVFCHELPHELGKRTT